MNKELQSIKALAKEMIKLIDSIEGNSSIESNNVSKLQSIVNSDKPKKLINKDREFIEKLIRLQEANNNNTSFLESLLNNDYDTLTEGQYRVVVDIANLYNESPDA
jgi:hypothetical protein